MFLGERNFYGALRVFELQQGGKALFHAHTLHGAQLNPPYDRLPLAYYGPASGIGILLQNRPLRIGSNGNLRVGVVGLGAGTLAAYGRPGDYFRYYEINPQVIDPSPGPKPVFTYVRDSAARVDIELGDARLLLEQEAAKGNSQRFDVLVLDAFSGDAVPVHLLTKEAFDIYAQHLRDDNAIIALHLSSRHINLPPVVEGLREYTHTYSFVKFTDGSCPFLESFWVFLAKCPESFQVPGLIPAPPTPCRPPPPASGGTTTPTSSISSISNPKPSPDRCGVCAAKGLNVKCFRDFAACKNPCPSLLNQPRSQTWKSSSR